VHWCRRQVRFREVPEKVPKVPQEKVPAGFGAAAGSGSTGFRKRLRRFRRRFWEALVQSQVRFNRVLEKVPGGFGAGAGSGSEKFVFLLFPQQRTLLGSSAQICSGVHRCRRQVRFNGVPEGSGA